MHIRHRTQSIQIIFSHTTVIFVNKTKKEMIDPGLTCPHPEDKHMFGSRSTRNLNTQYTKFSNDQESVFEQYTLRKHASVKNIHTDKRFLRVGDSKPGSRIDRP